MVVTQIVKPKELMMVAKHFSSTVKNQNQPTIAPITNENRKFLNKNENKSGTGNISQQQKKSEEISKKSNPQVIVITEKSLDRLRTTIEDGELNIDQPRTFANVFMNRVRSLDKHATDEEISEIEEKLLKFDKNRKSTDPESTLFRHSPSSVAKDSVEDLTPEKMMTMRKDNLQKQLAIYLEAVKNDPENATLYFKIGVIYKYQRKFEKAISQFVEGISINPNLAEAYNELGDSYHSIIDADKISNKDLKISYLKKAAVNFKSALRINPRFADAYYNLGLVYLKLGLRADGELNFKKACNFGSAEACEWLKSKANVK